MQHALQHCCELKSVVARFTTHAQTCLATNQIFVGYEKFSCRKWRVVSFFGTKSVYVVRFTDPGPRGWGVLPCKRLMGMCRSIELLEWGRKFSDI